MAIVICLAFIIATLLFLVCPAIKKHTDLTALKGLFIAHRGLHSIDKAIPENSLSAFKAAVENGFAIEIDIHLTADGEVVVFHDDDLLRVCGVNKKVYDMTLAELKKLRLFGTNEQIPTLKECLDVIDAKVPLLIEFKVTKDSKKLCAAADEILRGYKGKYFIQSFYPQVLLWYKNNRNDICRGQLSTSFKGEPLHKKLAGCLFYNFISRPHFVSYEHTFKDNFFFKLCVLLGAFPVGWTFKSKEQITDSKKDFESYIFEDFIP